MDRSLPDALRALEGPVAWVGIGNVDRGDDGFGVRLAEALAQDGCTRVVAAGTTPENRVEELAASGCAHVVLLDAAGFEGEPGSAVFLDAAALEARFPQVSTHTLSLGLLARMIAARGPRVWLLGVRPLAVAPGTGLSEPVRRSVELLRTLVAGALGVGSPRA